MNVLYCPQCKKVVGGPDHRACILDLLRLNKIQNVSEWEALCKKRKVIKGARVPKE